MDSWRTLRVALVHDYLFQMGGAERVLLALHTLFPSAPIFTSLVVPDALTPELRRLDLRPSFMQRLPGATRHPRAFLPLYPRAMESLDLRGYDLVISDSSAFAKGAIAPPGVPHLCYCHTPMRWVWRCDATTGVERLPRIARLALPPVLAALRRWDVASSDRVTQFIANSPAVADRIHMAYGRVAEVIPPPVDVTRFTVAQERGDAFVILSRLVPYKRLDLAVQACTRLGMPLRVIGAGRDEARLRALAGPSVTFLGALPDRAIQDELRRGRALLFPGEEDFGIAPVEAMACGRPVIAYAAGGALATVIPGVTGSFFHTQTTESLMAALASFQDADFDPSVIRRHAEAFDTPRFHHRFRQALQQMLGETAPVESAA
jgi:glycosyltransferase involved in cell wall biosynthesis